jgi:signal transduction histidine kinase/DNA-binding response OmpR family regulator
MTLPGAAPSSAALLSERPARRRPTDDVPVDVLLVDDDDKNLRALRALLAEIPARFTLARSAEEALRYLLGRDFALILMDVQMPGLNGLEAAALIRQRERSRYTPIIFLTAFNRTDEQLVGAYRLGAVDFMTKPIVPAEILKGKVGWFVDLYRMKALLERERERARAAELREHERAVESARHEGEREALRHEMAQQRSLLERLRRSSGRLELLAAVGNELLRARDTTQALPPLLERLRALLGADVYLLHLCGPDGALALAASTGVSASAAAELSELPPEQTTHGAAAASRGIVAAEAGVEASFASLHLLGASSACSFPLQTADRLVGTLTLAFRAPAQLEQGSAAAVEVLAGEVAMALERDRLMGELERRAEDLAEASRHKDEFLAMLAHELRNPLAPILHGVELLRDPQADAQTRGRVLDTTDRQVRHMARLVEDLVDVSRIRTGKIGLRRAPVQLRAVVDAALQALEPLLRDLRHELSLELPDGPVWIEGDLVRLTQVIENLVHNAAKYTDPGGHIGIAAEAGEGQVTLRVTDDGIGIPEDVLPHVFDVFVQAAQSPDRPRGGLGLGLALVKSIIELHGGSVVARSAGHGRGSELIVSLPTIPPPPAAATPRDDAPPPERDEAARPLRIAVVDDNADVRETLGQLLVARGYAVLEASDGSSAVDLIVAEQPDVALIDIGLPGLDGYAVASRVREAARNTRLVAVTGYGRADDRQRALDAGFDAHLVKPVELAELTRTLERLS